MKASASHQWFLLPVLIAGLALAPANRATTQTLTVLHTFAATSGVGGGSGYGTNSDGAATFAGLILSGNTLYGTAPEGGTNGYGTVFSVDTNGTNFATLHTFTLPTLTPTSGYFLLENHDGAEPSAGLISSENTLYGTADYGGTNGQGTVFSVDINGSNFTTLHTFAAVGLVDPDTDNEREVNSDGAEPSAGLILSGNTLYGTTPLGGTNGTGTVFSVDTNGSNFTTLHTFTAAVSTTYSVSNSDGAFPKAGLILAGNTLYGMAPEGGTNADGTIFAVSTSGSNFTTLHTFTACPTGSNSDGAYPDAGLILSGNTLYGTVPEGGTNAEGTIFAVSTSGSNFTTLHTFAGYPSDGASPVAGLTLSSNTLYGAATEGGANGSGTVFAVNTNGMEFTNLYSFSFTAISGFSSSNSDGAEPSSGLILSGNTLYGTAEYGGTNGSGTVFSLTLGTVSVSPPQLTLIRSGTNVILTWPTNAAGFTLEFATNLVSPVWNTNLPAPVKVNTYNAVTNGISGTRKFYRLSQ